MSALSRTARTTLLRASTRPSLKSSSTAPASRIRSYQNSFPQHRHSSTPRQPLTSRTFSTSTRKMVVKDITNKAEFDEAIKHDVVVVDFFATWCGPCKVIAPKLVVFSEEFPNAHFIKVDVDEVPDVAQDMHVRAMPTFFIFKDGQKVGEVVGANPPALKAAIQAAVNA